MSNVIKLVLLLMALVSTISYAGDSVNKTLALNGASKVVIENQRGKVNIIESNDENVSVQGELDDKAQAFIFEHSGATIIIKVEMPNNQRSWRNDNGSNLTIKIPNHVRVSFSGVSSDVNIEGFKQGVDIKTVSGEITASHLNNIIDINSISGDIESKALSGKIQISTVSGDLEDKNSSGRVFIKSVSGGVRSKSNASEILVETVSGDIDLKLAAVDELDISTVSGDNQTYLSLNENGSVKLSSVSGDFDIKFANNIEANFRLKTNAGGSIENMLTLDKAERGKYTPNEKLNFTTGNGNGSVKATTVSGDIKLSKL
ncbi:DUF4097 family beta strand repeat-containing protein [Thalassotalea profundi]|uniref:DUF4097 domain-containing protein n=1 Tax=Thalassotalea profundi TaxID=2036687 RepID=A0ABQ3IWP2_9GAMM|nr:DUF4097 family beta strand repeat-containing protein [Thalassotalea profundi]GHE93999.1 hypothetical protein GCM10011501_24320 [Thalassotalea profundi]